MSYYSNYRRRRVREKRKNYNRYTRGCGRRVYYIASKLLILNNSLMAIFKLK